MWSNVITAMRYGALIIRAVIDIALRCESFKNSSMVRKSTIRVVCRFVTFMSSLRLPHELNNLVLYNKKILYNLLFESHGKHLKTLGKDPKRLHGEMGMLSILHTWGQNLSPHNHVHCIVPGGALRSTGGNGQLLKLSLSRRGIKKNYFVVSLSVNYGYCISKKR